MLMGSFPVKLCPSNVSVEPAPLSEPEIISHPEIRFPTCVICYVRPVSTACLPCGHAVMCGECVVQLKNRDKNRGNKGSETAPCPICRTVSTIHQIVHLKYPEDVSPYTIDNADCLALHRCVTDAAEAALDSTEQVASQLIDALQSTRALADDTHRQNLRVEQILGRLETLESCVRPSISKCDSGVQVDLPSPAISSPRSLSPSLIARTDDEEFR